MAKTKTPFLSLGSQGTIGKALTTQKRGSETLVRSKPEPAYRYTLPQAYQRWLYKDYAYLWTQQSLATRQSYATGGAKLHLTGFQYWMEYCLKNLPDIAGWWKLDEKAGAVAYDSSRQGNNGAIIGASPISGRIADALAFDGLNDRVTIPHDVSINPTSDFSLECFIYITATRWNYAFIKYAAPVNAYSLYCDITDRAVFGYSGVDAGWHSINPPAAVVSHGAWHFLAASFRASDAYTILCLDQTIYTTNLASTPSGNTAILQIGAEASLGRWLQGRLDNLILYNRYRDSVELLRHSERRYPV